MASDPYRHLTGGPEHERPDWTPPARSPGPLTDADVREIRRALAAPYYADQGDVAAHFGISRSMVSAIKTRRAYAHVDPGVAHGSRAAELRLGSFDARRGQKARTRAATMAWEMM